MTYLEVMHIRNKVQEFICIRFINRQIGEFNGDKLFLVLDSSLCGGEAGDRHTEG